MIVRKGANRVVDRWLVVLSLGSGQTRNMALDRYSLSFTIFATSFDLQFELGMYLSLSLSLFLDIGFPRSTLILHSAYFLCYFMSLNKN